MPETVSVRKVNGLPRASFSRNLAVQALPLAMCLAPPPALRDFHPVESAHAERTSKRPETTALVSKPLDFIKNFNSYDESNKKRILPKRI